MTTSLTTMANASDQSLAGFSNTPSEKTSESTSHLAEPVKKCIAVLEQAETDTGGSLLSFEMKQNIPNMK
jgi:hypothetical protein